jgi:hypothetical protein
MTDHAENCNDVFEVREVEALDAWRQTQDSPQDLQTYDIRGSNQNQVEQGEGCESDTLSQHPPAQQSGSRPKPPADDILKVIKRHSVLTEEEVDAMTLWLLSSYIMDSFRIFPKLSLISPEKRCGKTTTLEVINSLANDGLMVSN